MKTAGIEDIQITLSPLMKNKDELTIMSLIGRIPDIMIEACNDQTGVPFHEACKNAYGFNPPPFDSLELQDDTLVLKDIMETDEPRDPDLLPLYFANSPKGILIMYQCEIVCIIDHEESAPVIYRFD